MLFVSPLRPRYSRTRIAAVAALLALPVARAPVHAASTRSSHSALADTTKPATFLHEVVVTGARFPRKFYQSPQALSFVTSAQLREQPPVTIGELLAQLPGVDISKDSPWEQRPVLRGLGGQRALVLVDGIPMNSARGNGPHPSLVDPSQIDHVEVVRGPSSVAYGSDALGGAINIITRGIQPSTSAIGMKLNGSVSLSGGTGDNQYGGSLDLQPRFGKLGLDLNGGGRHADDFKAPDGKVPHSAFRDWDGSAQARYDYDELTTLKAGWQLYRGTNIGIPGLSSPIAKYPDGWNDVFSFKNYDRDLANLSVERSYPHSWIASSLVRLYWQGERRNFFDAQDLAPLYYQDPRYPDGSTAQHNDFNRNFDLKTWGLQVQATSVKTKDYRFTMGLDAARDVTAGDNVTATHEVFPTGPGATTNTITQSVPYGHFDNYGVYFENEWYLRPEWTLSTGARYTQYAYRTQGGLSIPADFFGPGSGPEVDFVPMKVDNGAASGSAGIVYSPTSDLHLSFNVANGYRQPNAQDLFFNGFASVGLVEGNPDLKPEKSISYDLGLRYENSREALSGNLFWSDYTDLIDAAAVGQLFPGFGIFKYQNISKARIWGGEAEGQWVLLNGVSAHATVAGAIGDITDRAAIQKLFGVSADKAVLGGVPPLKGSFGLRWDDSDRRFWAEPSMRYSWRTNRLPLPTGDVEQLIDFKKEWLVVDVMAGMRIDYVHRFTLGVRNVGDRRYREALASLPSPGRAFVASFSASF
jgi:hemoglobin/transferrin/lactoferrin receptor protein